MMPSKKKSSFDDEIDLVELFNTIWKNKFKLLFISFLPAIILYFNIKSKDPIKPLFKTQTEIRPISLFDEFEYKNYNDFIESGQNKYRYLYELNRNNENINLGVSDIDNLNNLLSFNKIDRNYLLTLFLEKISDEIFLAEVIKKSNLIKKEDFENINDYEIKIIDMILVFELSPGKEIFSSDIIDKKITNWYLNFETTDVKSYKKFLIYLEKYANLEIQKYLEANFNESIVNQKLIEKYKIDDLNIQLSSSYLNEKEIDLLKRRKLLMMSDKSLERLQTKFNFTPIIKSKDFHASEILVTSTQYKRITKKNNILLKIFATIFTSTILGIFVILIYTRVKK